MMNIAHRLCGALASSLLISAAAHASTLLGTEYGSGSALYTMNQATGAAQAGPNTSANQIGDLASDGSSNHVWAVQIGTNKLLQFDAMNGAILSAVLIDSRDHGGALDPIVSLAWNPVNHTLYGTSAASFGGANNLFSIDTGSGAATLLGNLQINAMYGLAFNNGGELYGTSGEVGETSFLWKIDPMTGAALAVGQLSTGANFDIAFRPEDDQMFMASTGSSMLYAVDSATAAVTAIGPYGAALNIAGLAFVSGVPEPQSLGLMLLGMGLLLGGSSLRNRGRI